MIGSSAPNAMDSVAMPDDDCCYFYEHNNFEGLMTSNGLCIELDDNGDFKTDRHERLSDHGWRNGIGSYSCGKNIILKLRNTREN